MTKLAGPCSSSASVVQASAYGLEEVHLAFELVLADHDRVVLVQRVDHGHSGRSLLHASGLLLFLHLGFRLGLDVLEVRSSIGHLRRRMSRGRRVARGFAG